jgi:hypothetical protein
MKRIYVKRSFGLEPFGFTRDKTDAQDYVAKTFAASALKQAWTLRPEYFWRLVALEQSGGVVYLVEGDP